jgi:hypothetical protein
MRLFVLVRDQDVSGFSGTGVVAEGVEFGDGRVAMRWTTNGVHSLVLHASLDELLKVHGHNGASRIEWLADQTKGEQA